MKCLFLTILFLFVSSTIYAANGKNYDIIVDCNGEGDFTTIQADINSISSYNSREIVSILYTMIFIKRC